MKCICGNELNTARLCSKCDTVFVQSTKEFDYGEAYHKSFKERDNTEIGQKLTKLRWDIVERHIKPATLLDFGAGGGNFVKASPFYCIAFGYDIKKFDDIDYRFFDPHSSKIKLFDAITFWDSLEHLFNPLEELKFLKENRLNKNGLFFISTPAIEGIEEPFTKWRHFKPDEHIWHFSTKGLCQIGHKIGLQIEELTFDESYLRKGNNPYNISTIALKNF